MRERMGGTTVSHALGRVLVLAVVASVVVQVVTTTPTLSARLDISPLSDGDASQRLDRATVEVVVLGCDLALRQGTAVALSANQVLTNQHVIGSFRSVNIAADGRPVSLSTAVTISPVADLALVSDQSLAARPIPLAVADPLPGESVRFAGYPHEGASGALADGLLVAHATVIDYVDGAAMGQPGVVMRLSEPARPGMSGGPVMDQSGRLAGVVFAVQSPTNDTLAIPVSVLRKLLAGDQPAPVGRCAG